MTSPAKKLEIKTSDNSNNNNNNKNKNKNDNKDRDTKNKTKDDASIPFEKTISIVGSVLLARYDRLRYAMNEEERRREGEKEIKGYKEKDRRGEEETRE